MVAHSQDIINDFIIHFFSFFILFIKKPSAQIIDYQAVKLTLVRLLVGNQIPPRVTFLTARTTLKLSAQKGQCTSQNYVGCEVTIRTRGPGPRKG